VLLGLETQGGGYRNQTSMLIMSAGDTGRRLPETSITINNECGRRNSNSIIIVMYNVLSGILSVRLVCMNHTCMDTFCPYSCACKFEIIKLVNDQFRNMSVYKRDIIRVYMCVYVCLCACHTCSICAFSSTCVYVRVIVRWCMSVS
jgi:hypothetical protein